MKATLLSLILAASAFAADSPGAGPLASTLEAWKQAMLKKDTAALDKMYSKDLSYTHSSAMTEDKAAAIAAIQKAPPKAIDFHETTTNVYGNTAVVHAKVDITNGENVTSKLKILMVWVKSGSAWQLVARQATKLP
jgi:ketosteroid isomerase-like protein